MNRESKLVNTHHAPPPSRKKVRPSLKCLNEESVIDVKLIIVHFFYLSLDAEPWLFFFFSSLKDYFDLIWVQLPVLFVFFFTSKSFFCSFFFSFFFHFFFFFFFFFFLLRRDENTLFFKLCFSPSQTERTTKSSRSEARPGRLKISVELAVVWSALLPASFQELSRQAPAYSYPLCTLPAQMPSAPSLQTRISPLVRNQ